MTASDKDTIYIDIDDEITGIIDKLRDSSGKIVCLVLPKRATVFQSIVNMKLLKRAADSSKKHLVLITSEAGLLPLAGAAGVHVAKTLNSKPEIPNSPDVPPTDEEETITETGEEVTAATAGAATVGALAGAAVAKDDDEAIELDNTDPSEAADNGASKSVAPAAGAAAAAKGKGKAKGKKDSKLKIPDFNKFRLLLIGGALLLILLIFGGIFAAVVLPKATINIDTNASRVNSDLNLNLSTTAKSVDTEDNTVPAKQVQEQKTSSQSVATTGQKNNGNKARGSVSVANCSRTEGGVTIPAGTGFSSSGNTYISQQTVTLPASTFTGGGRCTTSRSNVDIVAQSGGTAFNIPGNSSFSISGVPSGVTGEAAGAISGGTDNIVKTVNQNDINNAKAKISSSNDAAMKRTLENKLKDEDYFPITATFSAGNANTQSSAQVGQVADSVTVTETVTYTMFGAKEDDLNELVDEDVKRQIDTKDRSILNRGLKTAVFTVVSSNAAGAQMTLQTTANVGPDLDVEQIRENAIGKKPGDVKAELESNSDITEVDVKLSPFWVNSVPKKTSKVIVNIAEPTNTEGDGADAENP